MPKNICDQSKKPTTFDRGKVKYDKTNPFAGWETARNHDGFQLSLESQNGARLFRRSVNHSLLMK